MVTLTEFTRDTCKSGMKRAEVAQRHKPSHISRSSQCSTTGVTKAVVCVILSVGWCI